MKWEQSPELSSLLDPGLTIRLVCPTKALALHGYRFSYALVPAALLASLGEAYSMLHGSGSVDGIACGKVAMHEITRGEITRSLLQTAAQCHTKLRVGGRLSAPWTPGSGYFTFERVAPPVPAAGPSLMDGSFFGQTRYPGYYRINLLSPTLGLLG